MIKLKNYLLKLIPKDTKVQGRIVPKWNVLTARESKQLGPKVKRKLGTAKGKIRIREDFDEPLDDFNGYT